MPQLATIFYLPTALIVKYPMTLAQCCVFAHLSAGQTLTCPHVPGSAAAPPAVAALVWQVSPNFRPCPTCQRAWTDFIFAIQPQKQTPSVEKKIVIPCKHTVQQHAPFAFVLISHPRWRQDVLWTPASSWTTRSEQLELWPLGRHVCWIHFISRKMQQSAEEIHNLFLFLVVICKQKV